MRREKELLKEREKILRELARIVEMRRGSVILQFFPRQRGGKAVKAVRGPYPLFTCKRGGRTVGFRIHSEEELKRLRGQVENFHRFQFLTRRLVEIGESLCELREDKKR